MAEFRCSFCGAEYSENDGQGRVFVVSDSATICDVCVERVSRQIVSHISAEREYLSWGKR